VTFIQNPINPEEQAGVCGMYSLIGIDVAKCFEQDVVK
jgi:hypothetical protein